MKVNELMLNDWVKVRGSKSNALCYKVDVISNLCLYDAITCGEYDFSEEEIEPIPLTEEILGRNALPNFVSTSMFHKITIDSTFCHISAEFKYVHELQHALRLCGLNELADNFKV